MFSVLSNLLRPKGPDPMVKALQFQLRVANNTIDNLRDRESNMRDIAFMLAERCDVSDSELVQLGLAKLVGNPDPDGNGPTTEPIDHHDALDRLLSGNMDRANVAKFRQIKRHFKAHQEAVTHILNQIDTMVSKNQITDHDRDNLRNMRDALSGKIGRKI